METINLLVCTGTTCFVMGAGSILEVKNYLSKDIADRVEITGSNCLDMCKQEQYGKAPFVKVNDKLIPQATLAKVIEEIQKAAQGK